MDYRTAVVARAGDENEALRQRFEQRLTAQTLEHLRHNPRLDTVATVLGDTFLQSGQLPVAALTQWLSWKAGVLGEPRRTLVVSGGVRSKVFDRALEAWAAETRASPTAPLAYGLVRFEDSGETVQALVLAADDVDLDPLPKVLEAGSTFTLSGRFRARPASATLYLDEDDARVREVPVTRAETFSMVLQAPQTKGRRFLELTVEAPTEAPGARGWRQTAVLLPLYVGVPEPTEPDVSIKAPAPNPADPATWSGEVAARYNQRRLELRLPPLEQSDGLEKLTRAYAAQQVADPQAPPDPTFFARLEQAGTLAWDGAQHRSRSEFLDELRTTPTCSSPPGSMVR